MPIEAKLFEWIGPKFNTVIIETEVISLKNFNERETNSL